MSLIDSGIATARESRYQAIHTVLRRRIVEGRLQPGDRLPTRDDLCSELSVSKITVQRALEQLATDGLVIARGRAGTFVKQQPQSNTVGLVFSFEQHDPSWDYSPYLNTLVRQAALLGQASADRPTCKIKVYYGVTDPWSPDQPQGLADDLKHGRLAGLIVVPTIKPWAPSAPLNLPVVSMGGLSNMSPDESAITLPWASWCERAIDLLVQSGCKRLAILATAVRPAAEIDKLADLARQRSILIKPQWVQGIYPNQADWARRSVHLLVDRDSPQGPDTLLITDDSLIDQASAGLVDAGVRSSDQLRVVTWANLPSRSPRLLPMTRLGFDLRSALVQAVDLITRKRLGQAVERSIALPVQVEDQQQAGVSEPVSMSRSMSESVSESV